MSGGNFCSQIYVRHNSCVIRSRLEAFMFYSLESKTVPSNLTSWKKKDLFSAGGIFPTKAHFCDPRCTHLAAGEVRPARATDKHASGFLGLQQSYHKAEMLQRCFSKKLSLGKNVAPFTGGKWFQILAFVFMENGAKFEGKPQNPLLLLKPQKLIKFFLKKKKPVFAEGWTFFLERLYFTFLFLKCLLRASWKVFLLAWLSWAQAFRGSTQKCNFRVQTLPFGDVFLLRSPDTGLTLPRFPGGHGACEAGEQSQVAPHVLNKIIEPDLTSQLFSLHTASASCTNGKLCA